MSEGMSVLLDVNGDRHSFAVIKKKQRVKVGKAYCSLEPLIGCAFGSVFEVQTLPGGGVQLARVPPPNTEELAEEEASRQQAAECTLPEDGEEEPPAAGAAMAAAAASPAAAGEGRDNRALIDNNTAQALSMEDIERMKREGASGEAILKALTQNSATYASKTSFSQEKYLRKKQKKYAPRLTAWRPSGRSVCEAYFSKTPFKTGFLRVDSLALLLGLANVGAFGDVLVVETCGGLPTAAAAERMAGHGTICSAYSGPRQPTIDVIRLFNLDAASLACVTRASCERLAEERERGAAEGRVVKEEDATNGTKGSQSPAAAAPKPPPPGAAAAEMAGDGGAPGGAPPAEATAPAAGGGPAEVAAPGIDGVAAPMELAADEAPPPGQTVEDAAANASCAGVNAQQGADLQGGKPLPPPEGASSAAAAAADAEPDSGRAREGEAHLAGPPASSGPAGDGAVAPPGEGPSGASQVAPAAAGGPQGRQGVAGAAQGTGGDGRRERAGGGGDLPRAGKPSTPEQLMAWARDGFSSMIVAAPNEPAAALVGKLLPLLAPSASFAIYHTHLQPLAECMVGLQRTKLAVGLQLNEPFLREHQILPGRSHPHMQMSATGGYILSGTYVGSKAPPRPERTGGGFGSATSWRPPKRQRRF